MHVVITFWITENVLVIKVILCLCIQPISMVTVVVSSLWFFYKGSQSAVLRPRSYEQSIGWDQVFFQSRWFKLMFGWVFF